MTGHCDTDGGEGDQAVECQACAFSWTSRPSADAVVAFWDERRASDPVVPIRKPARVTVPRGKIPSGRAGSRRSRVALTGGREAPAGSVEALAASGVRAPKAF